MRSAVALLLLLAPLSGCVDALGVLGKGDEASAGDTNLELPPGLLADRSTPGQLRGIVTSPGLEALGGANVTLLSLNRTFVTGPDGLYLFTDLPNGRVLVFTQREGFLGKTQSATIRNGTIVTLDFRLEPVPVVEPYHESVEFAGLIACDGMLLGPGGTTETHCGTADPNDKRVFETEIMPSAKSIIAEVAWDAALPTAQALRVRIETVGFGAMDAVLANGTGRSVLRLEIPSPALEKYYPQGGTLRIVAGPAPSVTGDEAATDAGFAVQQSFSVYFTAFYHASAPAGFSVLAPQ